MAIQDGIHCRNWGHYASWRHILHDRPFRKSEQKPLFSRDFLISRFLRNVGTACRHWGDVREHAPVSLCHRFPESAVIVPLNSRAWHRAGFMGMKGQASLWGFPDKFQLLVSPQGAVKLVACRYYTGEHYISTRQSPPPCVKHIPRRMRALALTSCRALPLMGVLNLDSLFRVNI